MNGTLSPQEKKETQSQKSGYISPIIILKFSNNTLNSTLLQTHVNEDRTMHQQKLFTHQ